MCVSETLTDGQWFVALPHRGPDEVRAMDAVLMAKLLGLVEPFSTQVLQLLLGNWAHLEPPDETQVHCNVKSTERTRVVLRSETDLKEPVPNEVCLVNYQSKPNKTQKYKWDMFQFPKIISLVN